MHSNRFKILRDLFILLFLAIAVFGGIYWYVGLNRDNSREVEKESLFSGKIENRMEEAIKQNQEFVEDDSLAHLYDTIKDRLLENQDALEADSVNIYLVEQSSINAYATIGNNIFITGGLTDFAKNHENVAAVIAHEIAHLTLNHPQNRLKIEIGGSVITSILTSGNSSMLLELSRTMMDLNYNRAQEREADEVAIDMLIEAQLHPQNLSQFLLRLKARTSEINTIPFLSTHPQSGDRITNIVNRQLPDDFEARPIEF